MKNLGILLLGDKRRWSNDPPPLEGAVLKKKTQRTTLEAGVETAK